MLLNSLSTHLQLKRNAHLSPLTGFLSQLCLPPVFDYPVPFHEERAHSLVKLMSVTNFPSHRNLIMSPLFPVGAPDRHL